MAFQLGMDKSLLIKALRDNGMSERAIAESLGVSRNAVRRHLAGNPSNDTKAPTGSEGPNDTTAPTGSAEAIDATVVPVSRSRCERFREVILSKREQGLDSQRIYQDLKTIFLFAINHEHNATGREAAGKCAIE